MREYRTQFGRSSVLSSVRDAVHGSVGCSIWFGVQLITGFAFP